MKVEKDFVESIKAEDYVPLKPMKCELDYLSRSDGSALLAQGGTVVLTSVNGPLDTKMSNQNMLKATFEVLYCPKTGRPSLVDRYKENVVRQACELSVLKHMHPRTAVTVTVQELEDNGGLMACVLNSVCLAFLNAGLPMEYVFAAVWCIIDSAGNVVLDPSEETAAGSLASVTFVFDSRERQLMIAFTDGECSQAAYCEAQEKCRVASESIFKFYKDIVRRSACTI